jgi:hypothetical protein
MARDNPKRLWRLKELLVVFALSRELRPVACCIAACDDRYLPAARITTAEISFTSTKAS